MEYKSNKQLKKLGDKQFSEDIKKYIRRNHEFNSTKIPELKILAKRLNEEYKLRGFYKIFNKFWNSGYNNERSIAIYALELYKEDFNIETWKFFKQKLKDIKSWDKVDTVSTNIIGEILLRANIQEDIIKMAKSNNIWHKRMALMACIPMTREDKFLLGIKLCEICVNSKDENVQYAIGIVLREIGQIKPAVVSRFIKSNKSLSDSAFYIATENMKELRGLRGENKNAIIFNKLMFWKD